MRSLPFVGSIAFTQQRLKTCPRVYSPTGYVIRQDPVEHNVRVQKLGLRLRPFLLARRRTTQHMLESAPGVKSQCKIVVLWNDLISQEKAVKLLGQIAWSNWPDLVIPTVLASCHERPSYAACCLPIRYIRRGVLHCMK